MIKLIYSLLLFLLSGSLFAQSSDEFIQDLYGFRLGQFREAPEEEFGPAIQSGSYRDNFEYELFPLKPDTSVYMIFEYSTNAKGIIWSIQITGYVPGFDPQFKSLKLSMTEDEVRNLLGEPDEKKSSGPYGTIWSYNNRNYTLEITPEGFLAGIKIFNTSDEYFPKQEDAALPNFKNISKILKKGDRKQIADLLSPSMEIYKNESTFFFARKLENEIDTDYSGIFGLIKEASNRTKKINTKDPDQYEEILRTREGRSPLHVVILRDENTYTEYVFQYQFGEYLIWEIAFQEE